MEGASRSETLTLASHAYLEEAELKLLALRAYRQRWETQLLPAWEDLAKKAEAVKTWATARARQQQQQQQQQRQQGGCHEEAGQVVHRALFVTVAS